MAKSGLFSVNGQTPSQVYEGDYMTQDKQFVFIWKKDAYRGDQQVAAIHLEAGYSIKLMQQ